MDMHPADREAPADTLQIAFEALVADALGRLLRLPAREGMGRRGDRRDARGRCDRCDRPAQPPQIGPRLVEARANPRPDLDLRAQKFGAHLRAEPRLAFGQHAVGRIADDVARRPVDEKILLLDAQSEFRVRRSPDTEDRAGDRARVAARPAPALDLVKEIGAGAVEQIRLFEIDRMPGVREHDECRGRDRALHQNARVRGRDGPRRRS